MTIATLIPTPAVRSIVESALDEVWRGRRALVDAFGAGERLRGANARPPGLAYALTRVRRLMKLARYAFLIVAAWFDPGKTRQRCRQGARAIGPALPSPSDSAPEDARSSRQRFAIGSTLRILTDDTPKQPQPLQLQHAPRNDMRTLARHIEALTGAMLDPMPHVRRLARALRRGDFFVVRRAPKRAPRPARRDHWDYLEKARDQASWELSQKRWRPDSS